MNNLFDLTGKVAVITGASSGLGVQHAKALGAQGAKLALLARREEKLAKVKEELKGLGYEVYTHPCDVQAPEQVKKAVAAIQEHYGTIDILINNAGLGLGAPADEMSDEDWQRMMDTNINGAYYMAREVGKIMKANQYGRIINLGSIHSRVALPKSNLMSAYCTTKGAIFMMTKALASEWAQDGITVNAVGPGYFASEMTEDLMEDDRFKKMVDLYCPMGRFGQEGELAGAIVYFASDASAYTTGQLLNVDGGWTAI